MTNQGRIKVLFTTPVLEHPPAGGPQLRIENSIKALGRVSDLHVVSRVNQSRMGGPAAEQYYHRLCRSFAYSPSCRWSSSNRYARKALAVIGSAAGVHAGRDARFLLDLVDRLSIDVLWFGYGNISFPLMTAVRAARPRLKLVCDTDSVWSRFILRELPFVHSRLRRAAIARRGRAKEAEERDWVELCDVTTGVSDVDEAYYRGIARQPDRIHRFSNTIDLASYREVPPAPASMKRPAIFLAGTFGRDHSPMNVAARWVIEAVLPRVRRAVPDAHLYLVGSGSDGMKGRVDPVSVTITGKVPSVLPYLCHADVSLVPLKFESGTRFKILEAAACGIPVVSTALGAEGLPVQDRVHLMLADDPASFAGAVIEVLGNRRLAQDMAERCRDLVQRQFSVEQLEHEGQAILDFTGRPRT